MAGKIYTPSELLRLKNTPMNRELYNQLQEKLRQDQELGEVLRMPLESSLARIMEEPANVPAGSESASPRRGESARQLDGTESEWRYRGRSDSEAIGGQPISAPTGLSAQKDEGFQRFYRAVVSPTHVRVTAGGRIVPNTRGSPSPTTRWPKDKSAVEGAENNSNRPPYRDILQQSQFLVPQHPMGFFPHHAMIPGFAPGMVPGMPVVPGMAAISAMSPMPSMPSMPAMPAMHAMHAIQAMPSASAAPGVPAGANPYPIVPWPLGFNISGPGGAAQPSLMGHASGLMPMPPNPATGDRQDETGASENATPTRPPPPESGEVARPYLHNGQWVFPSTAHFAMGPHPVHPAFMAPSMVPMVAGHRLIPNHIMAPMAQSNGQAPQISPQAVALPPPLQVPSVPTPTPSNGQHQSSIRASQITKKQLSVLRASLKWAEDQLQYNKHQIDERTMELHAESLRYSIGHFEKVQDEQAANEKRSHPKDQAKDDMSDFASADEERSKSPVTSSVKPENSGAESFTSLPEESSMERADKAMPTTQRKAFTSSHEEGTVQVASTAQILRLSDEIGANKRSSTLPVTAALAPPFQPRAVGGQDTRDVLPSSGHPKPISGEDESTKPYLVGLLPPGMRVEQARDTDYIYPRQLTEDELRARHMYWGKAPHHLQSGLPKFDGKNFYPPSPDRSQCGGYESEVNLGQGSLHTKASQVDNGDGDVSTDPFQSSRHDSRQYERGGVGIATESSSSQHSGISTNGGDRSRQEAGKRAPRGSRNQMAMTGNPNARSESDSPDENDEKSIVFKGRNSLRQTRPRPRSGIWHDMMKRGTSSSGAVPGTVSSTTVQGVLPHYSGHATASLTPTATNISSSREQTMKSGNANEGEPANLAAERQIENRPLGDGKHNAYSGVQGSKKRTSML
ncbi:hypothetical protein THAR02_06920 [Trichoderma harzianum]|uniref:Uncharacterized protein n=1 Tax=Trichoderma harzianum TaxID=5544 RepID=A0A0F9ZL19_TRIHA|nr:hypothetical protein THAR02_06920 [Trichoderma harzianum]